MCFEQTHLSYNHFKIMPYESEKKESIENKGIRKGIALKAVIAVTNALLSREAKSGDKRGFLVAAMERTRDTYRSLQSLEDEIDPSGNLSAAIEDRLSECFEKLIRQEQKQPEV